MMGLAPLNKAKFSSQEIKGWTQQPLNENDLVFYTFYSEPRDFRQPPG